MSVKHANNCPKMDDDSEVSKSVHILSGNDDVQSIDANHLMLIITRSSLVLYRLGVGRGIEEFCFCDNKIYLIPYGALQYSYCPPHWQLIRNFL